MVDLFIVKDMLRKKEREYKMNFKTLFTVDNFMTFLLVCTIVFLVFSLARWVNRSIMTKRINRSFANEKYWFYEKFIRDGYVFERSVLKEEFRKYMIRDYYNEDSFYFWITDIETGVFTVLSYDLEWVEKLIKRNDLATVEKMDVLLSLPLDDITIEKLSSVIKDKTLREFHEEVLANKKYREMSKYKKELLQGKEHSYNK